MSINMNIAQQTKYLIVYSVYLISCLKHISPKHAVMTKIRTQYITNPDFNLGRIKDVSSATVGLAKWVLALEEYDRVSKVTLDIFL